MGHLYKGGMWFKKKAYISGYNSYSDANFVDRRTQINTLICPVSSTPLSAADAGNYFYLPALGQYYSGLLYAIGSAGNYWSSSASSGAATGACGMLFTSSSVHIETNFTRTSAFRVDGGFE